MSLPLHLAIHITLSLLAGIVAYTFWKKPAAALLSAVAAGVLVDIDHHIDYFLAFGASFNWSYFVKGYQFLKSDHVYIFFHGWEYVLILILLIFLLKSKTVKTVFLGLALGLFFHLVSDCFLNSLAPEFYSVAYRAANGFEERNLATPENHEKHLRQKAKLEF